MTLTDTIAQVHAETEAAANPLPTRPSANGAFSPITPDLQLYWDSTSLGAFETCPRYYAYAIIEGRVPRGTVKVDLFFGQMYQLGRELYDRARAAGIPHEPAVLSMIREILIRTWDPKLGRPWTTDDPMKNRETLIRALVWYHDQFAEDDLETVIRADGEPMVEQSFRFDTGIETADGEPIYLCGHLDRVARSRTTGRGAIVDHKTTRSAIGDRYFERYSPDTQVSIYDIAGEVVMRERVPDFIIDAAQLGATFARFQRGNISRTPAQREEFMEHFAIRVLEAQLYAKLGTWPQNAKACNAYSSYQEDFDRWKGGCPFRPVCGSDPSVRPAILAAAYERRVWDPTQPRTAENA